MDRGLGWQVSTCLVAGSHHLTWDPGSHCSTLTINSHGHQPLALLRQAQEGEEADQELQEQQEDIGQPPGGRRAEAADPRGGQLHPSCIPAQPRLGGDPNACQPPPHICERGAGEDTMLEQSGAQAPECEYLRPNTH
uniref:Uncharacterized protein n=1 Tax=Sciurus vulgaris TaxID=55149 RepID=A0A8D2DAL5_SCIVU